MLEHCFTSSNRPFILKKCIDEDILTQSWLNVGRKSLLSRSKPTHVNNLFAEHLLALFEIVTWVEKRKQNLALQPTLMDLLKEQQLHF